MTAPIWLIAGREFRAYTTTASFWVALAVGPLVMAGALALTRGADTPAAPIAVAVHAADPDLARSASAALAEAGRLEGRRLVPTSSAAAKLDLAPAGGGGLDARFSSDFPLSPSGQMLVARTVERDAARAASLHVAGGVKAVRVTMPETRPAVDAPLLVRFSLVMILWTTLTGSLGMLLQAVVRERANRALEGLLAAARPWEIVLGKLIGVGAVSVLVLFAWLGSVCGLAAISPGRAGLAQIVIDGLAAPAMLVRASAIYLLGYLFYGLVTVAVGAAARDSASAQNLARPMFAVLLAAFFATLAAMRTGGRLAWLALAPPFTPFMLLLNAPGSMSVATQILAVVLSLAGSAIAGGLAVRRLTLSGAPERQRGDRAAFWAAGVLRRLRGPA